MSIDKVSLRKLRKRLPTKFMEPTLELMRARNREVGKSFISQILSGERFDKDAIECLSDVADKNQAELDVLKARARGEQQHA